MSINISQAFKRTSANAVDESLTLTKAQMLAVNDNLMPAKYFTVCQDDGYIYLYDKSATPSVTTGKFTKFEGGGGGGASSLEDLEDVLLTSLANGQTLIWDSANSKWVNGNMPSLDNCYQVTDPDNGDAFEDEDKIPIYNVSVSARKHFTWANLKLVLKAYFDTIYSTITSLGGLTDTNISTPTDGQYLKYNSTSGKWVNASGGGGGTTDYDDLDNKPSIEGVTLSGNKTASDLGLGKVRELTSAQYAALSQEEKMNGTAYYLTDGEGGGTYSIQKATLQSGSTTVTFTIPTTGDYLLDVYTSDGRNYSSVDTSVSGSVTITFDAPSSNVTVYLEVKGV